MTPRTEAGKLQHELSWTRWGGDDGDAGALSRGVHAADEADCRACRAIAAIEQEAATLDRIAPDGLRRAAKAVVESAIPEMGVEYTKVKTDAAIRLRDVLDRIAPDPDRPQWEDCKVCGGDHWTKDHPGEPATVPPTDTNEYAWLVEDTRSDPPRYERENRTGPQSFTTDPHTAHRYATKADADAQIAHRGYTAEAIEHGFIKDVVDEAATEPTPETKE